MLRAVPALAALLIAAGAAAQERPEWRLEVKRDMVSHGTEDEQTKTTLRAEHFPGGAVALLRLDVPLPDQKQDFQGDPFEPRLGDIKGRIGFRAWTSGELRFPWFVELTLPTADPESLGTGKYQLGAGQRVIGPVQLPFLGAEHRSAFEAEVEQVVSFAGDAARKDINTTKLELTLNDLWRGAYTFKLKLKPRIDWVQDGDTGAVAEVEGGVFFGRLWRAWLMLGTRVWGPDTINGTYKDKVEIGINRTF
ncbi:MAG TPA: hypothetical protein VF110_02570 [Burkholderiales bacterium]